jgi:hypothetical protein
VALIKWIDYKTPSKVARQLRMAPRGVCMRSEVGDWESNIRCLMQDRLQNPNGHAAGGGRWNRTPRGDEGEKQRNVVEDSLVNVTRPGYKTLSRSFSDEMPSTPFSPSRVAVDWAGADGGKDETPSRVDREAWVGLGGSLLPTGRRPGDTGLVKESSYSSHFSTIA